MNQLILPIFLHI